MPIWPAWPRRRWRRAELLHAAVVDRQPLAALALRAQVAEARKRDMGRADEVALLRRVGTSALALQGGAFAAGVELDCHRRVGELHRRHVHQVTPQHQLAALALDHADAGPAQI